MKLFTRYNRLNLGMMVVIFLLSSVLVYFLLRAILIHELDEDLSERKDKIEAYASVNKKLPVFEDLDDIAVLYQPVTGHPKTKKKFDLVDRFDPEEKRMEGFRQLSYDQQVDANLYHITIAKPLEGMHGLLRVMVSVTLLTILLIIIATILLNRLLLKKLWQPFYDTIMAMRMFKIGHKQPPVFPETDIDEFIFLKENLQQTMDAAHGEYHLLKEFTENASHELQTPLAIIRSKLDLLIQEEDLSERQSELLGHTYGSIKKLARLNQSLLLLTKIENQQYDATQQLELKQRMQEKIGQFAELWQNNEMHVSTQLSETLVNANPELIDILLNNLLSNASKHNVNGGDILISLEQQRIIVENTAIGGALDRTRLFRRFYKEEQNIQNNGLGLSIVKEICDQSGIKIAYSFENNRHRFSLSLP